MGTDPRNENAWTTWSVRGVRPGVPLLLFLLGGGVIAGTGCPGPVPATVTTTSAGAGAGTGSSGHGGGFPVGSGAMMSGSGAHTTSSSTNQGGGVTVSSTTGNPSGTGGGPGGSTSISTGSGCVDCGGGNCVFLDSDVDNCGACGRGCFPGGTASLECTAGVCTSPCAPGLANLSRPQAPTQDDGCEAIGRRVFVTSSGSIPANLGGTAAMDQFCQTTALGPAALGGSWKSWTSDSQSSPSSRFNQIGGPFVLLDGTQIAVDWSELTSGLLENGISIDEGGNTVDAEVWTGTNFDGTYDGLSCSDWTDNAPSNLNFPNEGISVMTDLWWTARYQQTCDRTAHLYCFEQPPPLP